MANMNYLIEGPSSSRRDEAVRRLRSAGFVASSPPRRLADDAYPLRVFNVAEAKQPEVDRMINEVAPGSQRLR